MYTYTFRYHADVDKCIGNVRLDLATDTDADVDAPTGMHKRGLCSNGFWSPCRLWVLESSESGLDVSMKAIPCSNTGWAPRLRFPDTVEC